jgi:hypothetical protein
MFSDFIRRKASLIWIFILTVNCQNINYLPTMFKLKRVERYSNKDLNSSVTLESSFKLPKQRNMGSKM